MREISLIGATGSIGRQTLSVVERYPEKFSVASMVAHSSGEEFLRAVQKFRPKYAALVDERVGKEIAPLIPDGVKFAYGKEAGLEAVSFGDTCLVATTGFSGLAYSLKAVEEKKDLALANKETLVCGGDLLTEKRKKSKSDLMPVDSEHSAIWQALSFRLDAPFARLILTASGGPFFGKKKEELLKVKASDALAHPTWKMGSKITVDSATLLNKGFEIIEAHHLYGAPYEKIEAVVQPESIVHSMVEFSDGGVIAQLSNPSMELPIQLALTYPERFSCGLKPLDFSSLGAIRFYPIDEENFPCFTLAKEAGKAGGTLPCALNGAGEIAVRAFLDGKIGFLQIAETIERVLKKTTRERVESYAQLEEVDMLARTRANEILKTQIEKA